MRYAILESGGKQYIAREGETIEVDRLPLEIGKPVEFDQVLLAVNDGEIFVGDPVVKGAAVKAKIVDQIKAKKIIVFKYVPKQRYRRKAGHRQKYTRVIVDKISLPAGKKASSKEICRGKTCREEEGDRQENGCEEHHKESKREKTSSQKGYIQNKCQLEIQESWR